MRVLLLPFDGRPVNAELPRQLGAIGGHEVVVPPERLLGGCREPADTEGLASFLADEAGRADAIVASADLLAHGGIEVSRDGRLALDEAERRLARAAAALRGHGEKTTVFSSITRSSIACTSEALLPVSESLHAWNALRDRPLDVEGAAERERHLARIPPRLLEEYDAARARNHQVQRRLVDWLRAGVASRVVFLQDDAGPHGPHVAEIAELRRLAAGLDATFLPGADEASALLVASALLESEAPVLRLGVLLSDARGLSRTAIREQLPFRDSFHSHLRPLGFVVDNEAPEVELFLHPPVAQSRDLFLEDASEEGPDLSEFVGRLAAAVGSGKLVFLADCGHANGADPRLLGAIPKDVLGGLAGFAAWNTASSTLGSILAHAATVASARRAGRWNAIESMRLTKLRILDDGLFQAVARREIGARCRREGIDRFDFGPRGGELDAELDRRLHELAAARLPFGTPPFLAAFPWHRLFEARVRWL